MPGIQQSSAPDGISVQLYTLTRSARLTLVVKHAYEHSANACGEATLTAKPVYGRYANARGEATLAAKQACERFAITRSEATLGRISDKTLNAKLSSRRS